MKITKNRYLQGFALTVIFLAIIRSIFPSVTKSQSHSEVVSDSIPSVEVSKQQEELVVEQKEPAKQEKPSVKKEEEKIKEKTIPVPEVPVEQSIVNAQTPSRFFKADGTPVKNRIYSVSSYRVAFPDSQSVQEVSAHKWGVRPVQNRLEAENRKAELVYVGSNP
jgi:hypothetical protein